MLFLFNSALDYLSGTMLGAGEEKTAHKYDKTLVYRLMCYHQDLFQVYMELKFATQQYELKQSRRLIERLFQTFSKLHRLEQRKLYPWLRLTCDNATCAAKVSEFEQFSNQYYDVFMEFAKYGQKVLQDNTSVEIQALEQLGRQIDVFVTRKEKDLYPLYNGLVAGIKT